MTPINAKEQSVYTGDRARGTNTILKVLKWTVPPTLVLAACAPQAEVVPPGTIEAVNVPPHNSPIYTHDQQVSLSLSHNSATNADSPRNVIVDLDGVDQNGASCKDHLSSRFTEATSDQRENHIVPFDVLVNSNGEDGMCSVTVKTQECVDNSCSGFQDQPFQVQVVFDTKSPQISVIQSTPDGMIQGNVMDQGPVGSPIDIVGAQYVGAPNMVGTGGVDSSGAFTINYIPEVGPKQITLTATDKAGNVSTVALGTDYEFNVGLEIQSMQLDGRIVDLRSFSASSGTQVQDGDIFVGINLPDNALPDTVQLTGEQPNWRNFGLKSTVVCDRATDERYDVSFVCTPASTSNDAVEMKFTFTDKFGHSFDAYYPQEAFFPVQTREMNTGEFIWYVTERAVAVIAGLSFAGVLGAGFVNSAKYQGAYEEARSYIQNGNPRDAFLAIDTTSFLTNGQRNRLKGIIQGELDEKVRIQKEEENRQLINELYAFQASYGEHKTSSHIPHTQLREALSQLNRMLQLGVESHHLQDSRNRPDTRVIADAVKNALGRWLELNVFQFASHEGYDWSKLQQSWGPQKNDIHGVLMSLFALETQEQFAPLWTELRAENSTLVQMVNEAALVFAYQNNLLYKQGAVSQKNYSALISRHMGTQNAMSALLKWGATGVGAFVEAIPDPREKLVAQKFFRELFTGK